MSKGVWKRIDRSGGDCWLWTGRLYKGYGKHGSRPAHRVVYELLVGPIPAGLEIDHLCKNPPCVNPAHLEPVTRAENMRRRFADYTTCINGHDYTPENTYYRITDGHRACRACGRERTRRYKARLLAQVAS